MKILRLIFIGLAAAGAFMLCYAAFVDTPSAWEPVTAPFPSVGLSIKDFFHVYRTREYMLEATVPVAISKDEMDISSTPPIDCGLRVRISGTGIAPKESLITSFHFAGRNAWGSLDKYASDESWVLKPGDYDIEFRTEKSSAIIGERGAMLSLAQFRLPVEAILFTDVLHWSGVVLCVIGLAGSLACALKKSSSCT